MLGHGLYDIKISDNIVVWSVAMESRILAPSEYEDVTDEIEDNALIIPALTSEVEPITNPLEDENSLCCIC